MANGPQISDVVVRQHWPWNGKVSIDYVLACDETDLVDVALKAYDGTTPLDLPEASLSGDLYGVSQGIRHIVWDPSASEYANTRLTQFNVTLTPTISPAYMIVDLSKNAGAEGQIEYVYPDDVRLAEDGNWYSLTNDVSYKTTKLVLRRIHPGAFLMQGSLAVQLTKGFYVGVFETTQWQWWKIMETWPAVFGNELYRDARPVERVSYNTVRGATDETPSINWPTTGYQVGTNSFMGRLRTRTGVEGFDLPTEAQWEYACRAGTTTYYNDGLGTPSNTKSNAQMNAISRYCYNGGRVFNGTSWVNPAWTCDPANGTALVGSYQANNWGLYDMHGNVYETCLDWSYFSLSAGADPTGPDSATQRVNRGGGRYNEGDACSSASRSKADPPSTSTDGGFRIVRVLP